MIELHNGETVSKIYKLHVFARICSGSDQELRLATLIVEKEATEGYFKLAGMKTRRFYSFAGLIQLMEIK